MQDERNALLAANRQLDAELGAAREGAATAAERAVQLTEELGAAHATRESVEVDLADLRANLSAQVIAAVDASQDAARRAYGEDLRHDRAALEMEVNKLRAAREAEVAANTELQRRCDRLAAEKHALERERAALLAQASSLAARDAALSSPLNSPRAGGSGLASPRCGGGGGSGGMSSIGASGVSIEPAAVAVPVSPRGAAELLAASGRLEATRVDGTPPALTPISENIREYGREGGEAALRRAFDAIDLDGSGTIGKRELYRALEAIGVEGTSREMLSLYNAIDADRSGQLDWEEFERLAARLPQLARLGAPRRGLDWME